MPFSEVAAQMAQPMIKLYVFVTPACEFRIVPIRPDEVRRLNFARARRQKPRHIETARPVIDLVQGYDIHVMEYEVREPFVVKGNPAATLRLKARLNTSSLCCSAI